MKAISIKQPWAWLIVTGIKDIENRNWKSNYRGRLLIHAPKTWDKSGYIVLQNYLLDGEKEALPEKDEWVFGAIIGAVTMVDCVHNHPSKWFSGPRGFVFEAPEAWDDPEPYRGQLGIFDVPDSIFAGPPTS